jgi:VWFA-related protein
MTRVRRVAPIAGLLTVLVLTAAPLGRGQQQVPRFRAGIDTVSIYATVVDDAGRLVPGLTREDFEVFDNGVRQDVTIFEDIVQPVTIVVMIDRSSSVEKLFGVVQEAAAAFVANLLPADRARIGSFSGRVQIDPPAFTSDKRELNVILNTRLQDAGPTPLWNATVAAIGAVSAEPGRRVVLIFTDGHDSSSPLATNATFGDVRGRVESDDVMLYAIGLAIKCAPAPAAAAGSAPVADGTGGAWLQQSRGRPPGRRGGVLRPPIVIMPPGGRPVPIPGMPPPTSPFPRPAPAPEEPPPCRPTTPDPGLRELAALGGGGYFELARTDDLASTFARVADELHHQYLLGVPAAAPDGKLHTIDVRVKPASLTVRARRSYVAPVK